MAAPTQQRKQVPKVFSERAKAASVQAQVANDILEAQVKGALAQRKASLKAQSNAANFMGSQLDSAAQARADAKAAGQEAPTGPEIDVAPLPNASQPSQGLAGATGLDLNALLTAPGATSGGAGIQAATGGMGRAGGGAGGSDPTGGAQMPGNVPPYLTSQRTTNTTQQFGDASGVLRVPVSSTVTETQPNAMSPYQAARLQQEQQKAIAYQNELESKQATRDIKLNYEYARTLSKLKTDRSSIIADQVLAASRRQDIDLKSYEHAKEVVTTYGEPLANLYALSLEGTISKKDFEYRKENILGSIQDPQLRAEVDAYGKRQLSTVQAERSLKNNGFAVATSPDGGVTMVRGNLKDAEKFNHTVQANTQTTLAFRKMQAGQSGIQQTDEMISLIQANPEIAGASGSAIRWSTKSIGAMTNLIPGMVRDVRDSAVSDIVKDLNKVLSDPNISPGERMELRTTAGKAIQSITENLAIDPYQPNDVARLGVMVNALRATLAKAELGGELNIRGYEALGEQFVDPTGWSGTAQVMTELKTLRERFERHANEGKADYQRMNRTAPNMTVGQILGTEPMPTIEGAAPEVTPADIYGYEPDAPKQAAPTAGPRILTTPPPGAIILKPEDLPK